MNVLIVDDEKSIRRFVADFFHDKGHTTVTTDCGEKALEKFTQDEFDLVMMDIVLPGIDGFETARQLQDVSRDEWVPIIFMSARNANEELRKGIMSGGGFYLPKPLNPVQLESYTHVMGQLINSNNALRHKHTMMNSQGFPIETSCLIVSRLR